MRVVYVEGGVTDAEALVTGEGGTTAALRRRAAPPPVVVLDFGKEIGGFPAFGVARRSPARPALRASYSETLTGLSDDGDYAGKTRLTRVQEHRVTPPGRCAASRSRAASATCA